MPFRTLLVVEDEILIAMSLRAKLEAAGFAVLGCCGRGDMALKLFREEAPDFVIMDINLLGGMSGIECGRIMRAEGATPILFTTGYDDETLREQAKLLAPSVFLTKPVELADITSSLELLEARSDPSGNR